jgi:urease alpha subunit
LKPGEYILKKNTIPINVGRKTRAIKVVNRGDRPIFVGSHYHFYEADPALDFNRDLAKGMRLNIASGEAEQFPPGDMKDVELVEIGGNKEVYGFKGYVNGPVQSIESPTISEKSISRQRYVTKYGPTLGDKVRLADTNLLIEVEKDYTVYGEELRFGMGQTIRSGMGMSAQATRRESLDLIITNALIVDYWGIIKADIGIKNGRIQGIDKGGNPDYMDGVAPNMVVGASTEVISGEGLIVTAGGVDSHVHQISPQIVTVALESGVTTLLGGGTGAATGSRATNISPGKWNIHRMLEAYEAFPVNVGIWGKGHAWSFKPLEEQVLNGAAGFKIHEDWGATPAVIDSCLKVADYYDVQVSIHTDSLNESGHVESTIKAINGRAIHTYHTEGAGGGHAPDIMEIAKESYVMPGSTTPTRPFTINTYASNLDMVFEAHHLNRKDPTSVAMAEARIRPETQGAEGILHDLGVLSIMGSDSMAMGHMGEMISRTWQTASIMKAKRGPLKEEQGDNDNFRVKRYIAKYTINPAISHGISHVVGSIEVGKMADLVLWKPEFFGVKPDIVVKGGSIVTSIIGNANGSISEVQPMTYRPMFGSFGKALKRTSVTFMSQAAIDRNVPQMLGLEKKVIAIRNTRTIGKKDMVLNDKTPNIVINPETFVVYLDGEPLHNPPVDHVPMGQRYFLF